MANKDKGGTLGSLVLVKLEGGSSTRHKKPVAGASNEVIAVQGKDSNKSPLVKIKEGIAEYFSFTPLTPAEARKALTRTRSVTYNGVSSKQESLVNAGATGKSRSVKVYFATEQLIGGKKVASVNVPLPASYTFNDMFEKLMASPKNTHIARITSPQGRSVSFKTPFKKSNGSAT
jgi:hypothetical protein